MRADGQQREQAYEEFYYEESIAYSEVFDYVAPDRMWNIVSLMGVPEDLITFLRIFAILKN